MVIRQLTTADGAGIGRKLRAELVRYQEEMLGRKFNKNPITYMEALLAIPHREDMSSVFCSQLVAGAYKRMGLLPPDFAASSYFPRDFSKVAKARLPLQNGAYLGPELTLRFEESEFDEEDMQSEVRMSSFSQAQMERKEAKLKIARRRADAARESYENCMLNYRRADKNYKPEEGGDFAAH